MGEMKTMSWLSRLACCLLPAVTLAGAPAQAADPFTFGMTISQTGGLAPGARAVLARYANLDRGYQRKEVKRPAGR